MTRDYRCLGLMSGSSLDGLDLAMCRFRPAEESALAFRLDRWELESAETLPFAPEWQDRLRRLPEAGGKELAAAHAAFGRYLGSLVRAFLADHPAAGPIDCIASHGHTVFHEPAAGFTLQIGDGAALSAVTGLPVVCDFRSYDVALGGQGAPLAPMADRWLYPGYDAYLNLGGIANISCPTPDGFVAFDVTGANQLLNALAGQAGQVFDRDGEMAAQGVVRADLLDRLNSLPYFLAPYPKSLSNQWVQENLVNPLLAYPASVEDRSATACLHIATQVCRALSDLRTAGRLPADRPIRLLATGGGALHLHLMGRLPDCLPGLSLATADPSAIHFKEACLMALLGFQRLLGAPNCLSTVTGARQDNIGGALHLPPPKP
jgi:anhydro-N-acetylmuramic acid kinase